MNTRIETKKVSENRPNYYNVLVNGKAVSEIRFPSTNPYLNNKTIQEIAELEAKRILSV